MPAFRNKARVAMSDVAIAPVCELAARLPADVLPDFIAAIRPPFAIIEAACLSNFCGFDMFSNT